MRASPTQKSWQEANKDYLVARLQPIREALRSLYTEESADTLAAEEADFPPIEHEQSAAFDLLSSAFDLSPFEQAVLLLCAGVELDSEFAQACAAAQGGLPHAAPTFHLALRLFPTAYWSALSPVAPLRLWRLLEVEKDLPLLSAPLRIDERILHYLVGVSYLDRRLANLFQPLTTPASLVPSHQTIANEVAATWQAAEASSLPQIEFYGAETASKRGLAALIGSLTGLRVFLLQATALPTGPAELEELLHLWTREALLDGCILLLDCQHIDSMHAANDAITRAIAVCTSPLIICSRELRTWSQCALLSFEIRKPTSAEQLTIWQSSLSQPSAMPADLLRKLPTHFSLDRTAIQAVCANVEGRLTLLEQEQASAATPEQIGGLLWEACRSQVRPGLGDLAERLEICATWEDLILPEAQSALLRSIAMHVRQREQVYETWGFAGKTSRGLGICALFTGGSGTGKTMAAEVLANELRLDLYRIDLSTVVSKYIGETEKHLQRIFDIAEEGSAILLFDEADALLGKRSEVKDSHDRYANIEVSYLLQRMEAYRGLVLLTTNMKDALDAAFLRRIRFVVQFPFPDSAQRAAIWQHVFPRAAPVENLDVAKLAQLNLAGGNIRNIALNAAFRAADAGEPIRMQHLLHAARHEYAKLEKAMTSAELQGWDG